MQQISLTEKSLIGTIEQAEMLASVLEWSAVNTGTANLHGLSIFASYLADSFSALPGEVMVEEPAPVTTISETGAEVSRQNGRHLVIRVRPEVSRRVLLTGHMDTVFPKDSPFQNCRWLDETTLNGPGVADMKGGIAVMLHALMAFERSDAAPALGYDVLLNSDEETGSLSSAPLIAELAQGKLAALTYEPSALPDGTLAHARGGSGNYSLTVRGKSAHAGRNPHEGRNAIVAASDLALRLKALQHEGISVNPARIDGGSANNVVPDLAILRFNIRPKSNEAAVEFQSALAEIIAHVERVHDVAVSAHGGITRPPKPVDEKSARLFHLVQQCGAALGQTLGIKDTGGVCDGNNIAACGVPVVDTMGVRGGSIHSPDEYLITPSLGERAALSALVLHRIAIGASL